MGRAPDVHAGQLRRSVVVLGLVLVSIGGAKAWLGLGRPALDVWRARAWVPAPVSAVRVRVLPFHGVDHTDTEYTYRAASADHVGDRYAFVDPSRFQSEEEIFALQSFRPETCWVDPSDPRRAVLVRELPPTAYRWWGLVVAALGLALLALAVVSRTGARAARIVMSMPWLWSRASAVLAAAVFALLALRSGAMTAMVITLALIWLAGHVWRRSPTALAVLAVLGVVVALGVIACAANPFARMDQAVDTANEPAFVVDYALDALLFATLGLATTLFALREREQAIG